MKKNLIMSIFVAVFLCSLNVYAQNTKNETAVYHQSVRGIIENFKKDYKESVIKVESYSFQANGKDFYALYLSAIPEPEENVIYLESFYYAMGTKFYICDKNADESVSGCRKVDLGGLTGNPSFVTKNDFITIELRLRIDPRQGRYEILKDSVYYLTLKYVNGDFYLHQFSKAYAGLETYQNGDIQNQIYYRVDTKNGYKIKMTEIGFEDLYPERYSDVKDFIKNYPTFKNIIDNITAYTESDFI